MKKLLLLTTFLLCAAFTRAQSCDNFWVDISPDGNKIVFSSNRDGGYYEIYSSDLDGISNIKRLTNSSVSKYYPSISPDGSKIAYREGEYGGTAEIFIMDFDGQNPMKLTDNSVYDGFPNFHPDGTKLVFSAWDGSPYPEIFSMDLDGSNRTQLTDVSGADWQSAPVYSPDGLSIYFLKGYNADNHVARLIPGQGSWVDITPPNTFGTAEANISFTPDGQNLVFMSTEYHGYNNGADLIMTDLDGGNWERKTISPDKEYHYQAVFHPQSWDIYHTWINTSPENHIFKMDSTWQNSVEISDCEIVGISPTLSEKLNLYPNPAINDVHIDFLSGRYGESPSVTMLDIKGKSVSELPIYNSSSGYILDVSKMNEGLYLMSVNGNGEAGSARLLIRR